MTYLFGPVNSRRLGLSLGIDPLPAKICNFNCIYCEVGATTVLTCERREYSPTAAILAEIDQFLKQPVVPPLDVFTITASGEPTLHQGLGKIIHHLKQKTTKPVVVITNGSLLHQADVRLDLAAADLVVPSLDAARPESYRRINRPAPDAGLDELIEGLIRFREEFRGKFWLEILFIKGLNDSMEEIASLTEAVRRIRPAKVQLNTVDRPPLETFAAPVTEPDLREIAGRFDGEVEIIVEFAKRRRQGFRPAAENEIIHLLRRRPCTVADICEALNLDLQPATDCLQHLEHTGSIYKTRHTGKEYYQTNHDG